MNTYKEYKVEQTQKVFGAGRTTIRHHFDTIFLGFSIYNTQNKKKADSLSSREKRIKRPGRLFSAPLFLLFLGGDDDFLS